MHKCVSTIDQKIYSIIPRSQVEFSGPARFLDISFEARTPMRSISLAASYVSDLVRLILKSDFKPWIWSD